MNWHPVRIILAALAISSAAAQAASLSISKVEAPSTISALPVKIGGRVQTYDTPRGATAYRYQWPGVYFETAFSGSEVYFDIESSDVIDHVIVDGVELPPLVKPAVGFYAVNGLGNGPHTVRIETVTESQAGPDAFGGFATTNKHAGRRVPKAKRQIEFIGDSHSVGYGNTSTKRDCTRDEIWATTNTSLAFGPLVAKHYNADYQVNAISGRGIVRNYNGFQADTMPQAYSYILFDKKVPVRNAGWKPRVIVIDLGTNDFSTALNPGEKWKTRDELHADFEEAFVRFVQELWTKNPRAYVILAACDMANGEIQSEVKKVVDRLSAKGKKRIGFVAFDHLKFTGCDWHPSTEDDQAMMAALVTQIDQQLGADW